MLTSSPRKRNSLGSRTAWLRPLRKIFAVGMIDTSLYQGQTAPLKQYCHRQRGRPLPSLLSLSISGDQSATEGSLLTRTS